MNEKIKAGDRVRPVAEHSAWVYEHWDQHWAKRLGKTDGTFVVAIDPSHEYLRINLGKGTDGPNWPPSYFEMVPCAPNTGNPFIPGNIVRRKDGRTFIGLGLKEAVVDSINGNLVYLEGARAPRQAHKLELVASSEEGVFAVTRMSGSGFPRPATYFTVWPTLQAAEEIAAALAEKEPNGTFGVLKLVGKVSMKPTWDTL